MEPQTFEDLWLMRETSKEWFDGQLRYENVRNGADPEVGKLYLEYTEDELTDYALVEINYCPMCGRTTYLPTGEDITRLLAIERAIKTWNRRAR